MCRVIGCVALRDDGGVVAGTRCADRGVGKNVVRIHHIPISTQRCRIELRACRGVGRGALRGGGGAVGNVMRVKNRYNPTPILLRSF